MLRVMLVDPSNNSIRRHTNPIRPGHKLSFKYFCRNVELSTCYARSNNLNSQFCRWKQATKCPINNPDPTNAKEDGILTQRLKFTKTHINSRLPSPANRPVGSGVNSLRYNALKVIEVYANAAESIARVI